MFFLEVYEESFTKPIDKSLLNVLTGRENLSATVDFRSL